MPVNSESFGHRLFTIIKKSRRRIGVEAKIFTLKLQNACSSRVVATGDGPVVSLTSHGKRVKQVHLAIESIAQGSQIPSRLILWLDDPNWYGKLPVGLKRLQRRGLEVRLTRNYGPHTKYYPYAISEAAHSFPLVTADDDIIYPPEWLQDLVKCAAIDSRSIVCHRSHRIGLKDGVITPYMTWGPTLDTTPSLLNFATGVSGVLYPPTIVDALREGGDGFLNVCRNADDIWINRIVVGRSVKTRQVRPRSLNLPVIPGGGQDISLYRQNNFQNANDQYLQSLYEPEIVSLLESARVEGTEKDWDSQPSTDGRTS